MDSNLAPKTPLPPEILEAFNDGRLAVIEAALMLLWNEHPERNAIKRNAITYLASVEVVDEQSSATDPLIAAKQSGRKFSMSSIFHELPQEQKRDPAHKP